MAVLLRLANVEKTYFITKTQKQDVLKGIDITFDHGELVALVGESGCGKSTLINIMGGLDSEYTGSVVCKGKFLRDYSETEMNDYRKKRVGLIFQNYNLIGHMTLIENVEIAMQMSDIPSKVRKERALDLLKVVGLDMYANKLPSQLSGGQQQRVAIARALANNPSIILADEPTGALDKESAEIIMQILKKIVESGKLVILVTHSHQVASQCSRIIGIDDGKIVSDVQNYQIKVKDGYEKVIMPKPIKTKELGKISYRNLKQKKSRSMLVSIGMSIGIAAIILILSLGKGLTHYVETVYADNLESLQITAYLDENETISSTTIERVNDINGIDQLIESRKIANMGFFYNDISARVSNLSAYYESYAVTLLYGTYPSSDQTIMVNETFASTLSSDSIISIIGTTIRLTYDSVNYTFTITGIYQDNSEASSVNNALVYSDDLEDFYESDYDTNILYLTANDVTYLDSIILDLEMLGFNVYQPDNSAQTLLNYIELGTKILTGVGAISMIVASIMIFIVLYISIVERTKEIGILRAIGAQKKDIRKMFFFEAGMLGFIGGLIGVVFSLLVAISTNMITSISLDAILISYSPTYYLLGLGLSLFVSVIAGIAPSIKASELDPVEALRYE